MRNLILFAIPLLLLASCGNNQQKSGKAETVQQTGKFQPADMREQMIYSRAIEAANWGMAAVNLDLMYQEAKKIGGDYNQIVIWPGLCEWKNQTLTPNPDVIYIIPFFNTKDVGPIVLEIPSNADGTIVGSIMDRWQMAIEDVGPGGVDKGKGGKYLFLPPGYKDKIPAGYIPMQSDTYTGYSLIRVNMKTADKAGAEDAVAYGKRIQLYPLSETGKSPQTKWVDASGKEFNSIIPYDVRFYESLDRVVQGDIWLTKDQAMIDPLKYIGIEKGKPFNPDARTKEILNQAIADAKIWFEARYEAIFKIPYYEGTNWTFPVTQEFGTDIREGFIDPNSYPLDMRGLVYTFAFFSARHIGETQYYLMAIKDKEGQTLKGSNTYRLNVPANVPVHQYWSVTVYNRVTHTLLRNLDRYSRSSQSTGIQKNADGSIDIYFGPKVPEGKEANWVPTDPNGEFELMTRFYGVDKSFFTKSWKMTDVEMVK